MSKTSNIFARVEPEIKQAAENVLDQLGISMSSAINIFLKQVVMKRGIPFEVKLNEDVPLSYSLLTEEEFNIEMMKGWNDKESGEVIPAGNVAKRMELEYGL